MHPREFQSTYPCVDDDIELLLYFAGELASHRPGLTAAIDAAWPLVAPGIRSFQTTNMKGIRRTKDGKAVLLRMLEERPSEIYNSVSVDNRRHLDEAPDCCLEVSDAEYRSGGFLLCRFPIRDDDRYQSMLDVILRIAAQWDCAHGYAGYTLALNVIGLKASLPERMFYPIGMRHPGIDIPLAGFTSFVIGAGIKRVNWLTLLGSDMARRAGSLNSLGRQAGVVVHKPGESVVIQAGDTPLIGDVNRQDTCEVYRRVGRALKGIRSADHPGFIFNQGEFIASKEKTEEWLSSLDE